MNARTKKGGTRKIVKKFVMFVIKTVLIVFAALLIAKVPQIFVANCGYMVNSDMGYVWVINFAIAFLVAWFVSQRLYYAEVAKGYQYAITICVFIIVTVLCESAIWHPLEIGTIIAQGITLERMACVGVGILASAITSFIERKKKTANSAKHSNKGKYSEPRTRDT